jgi:hypothetical protein
LAGGGRVPPDAWLAPTALAAAALAMAWLAFAAWRGHRSRLPSGTAGEF